MRQPLICGRRVDIDNPLAIHSGFTRSHPVQCNGDPWEIPNRSYREGCEGNCSNNHISQTAGAFTATCAKNDAGKPIRSPGDPKLSN